MQKHAGACAIWRTSEKLPAVMQYAEKLDDARKKKLEEMIAAARSGKPHGSAPKAAAPEKVVLASCC